MDIVIPNVPTELQQAFEVRALAEKKTVAKTILDAAARDLGITALERKDNDDTPCAAGEPVKRRDLSDIAGTWIEDPQFDAIIEEQSRIDPELWK